MTIEIINGEEKRPILQEATMSAESLQYASFSAPAEKHELPSKSSSHGHNSGSRHGPALFRLAHDATRHVSSMFLRHPSETKLPLKTQQSPLTKPRKESAARKLWAKARDKLPELNLQTVESQSTEADLGSSVEDLMEIKLWVCVAAIVLYLAIGAISYSCFFEHWSIVDSLYFTMVTFTTVGYGDMFPTSDVAMLFTAVFSLVGISFLGVALGVIGSKVIEYQMTVMAEVDKAGEDHVLSLFREEEEKHEKQLLAEAHSFSVIWRGIKTFAPVFSVLLMGSFLMAYTEGWSWKKAIYFCTMTATTVGYGDFVPSTERMRLFAVFYIPILVGVMSQVLGSVATWIMDMKRKALLQNMKRRQLRVQDLMAMDLDGDGNVTELEFIEFMLLKMHKVDAELLLELRRQFRYFDVDHSGVLAKSDLYELLRRRLKQTDKKLQLSMYKTSLLRLGSKEIPSPLSAEVTPTSSFEK